MERIRTLLVVALVVLAGCTGALGGDAAGTPTPAPAEAIPHPATAPTVEVRVTEVVDGDTVKVRYPNGTADTVRLLGVDTPEVRGENTAEEFAGVPSTAAGRDCLRRAGETASAAVQERLAGARVGLGFDPAEDRRGYYGRLLAYVYVDGEQFNRWLVAAGHARVYESAFVEGARYAAAEQAARAERRGLWRCVDPSSVTATATATVTPAAGEPLAVSVHPDAEGADNQNLNDEYVVLRNAANRTLDLSGWTVTDEAGKRYTFPDGTTLAPDESLRLHSGSGPDGDGHYYWGRSGSAVWNNDGDTVTVRDANATVVATRSY